MQAPKAPEAPPPPASPPSPFAPPVVLPPLPPALALPPETPLLPPDVPASAPPAPPHSQADQPSPSARQPCRPSQALGPTHACVSPASQTDPAPAVPPATPVFDAPESPAPPEQARKPKAARHAKVRWNRAGHMNPMMGGRYREKARPKNSLVTRVARRGRAGLGATEFILASRSLEAAEPHDGYDRPAASSARMRANASDCRAS
jgi:hypothetical protein